MTNRSSTPEEKISALVVDGLLKIEGLFLDNNSDLFTIDMCRAMDFNAVRVVSHQEDFPVENSSIDFDFMKRGYPLLLRSFYKVGNFRIGFPVQMPTVEAGAIADITLMVAGKHSVAEQLVKQSQADLVQLTELTENTIAFKYQVSNSGVEYLANMHIAAHFDKVQKSLSSAFKKNVKKQPEIRATMKSLVFPDKGFFIKYDTSPEIDRFFSKMGHYRLMTTHLFDIFDDKALFGGIEYFKYIRVLKELIGMAFKHTDYCACLVEKNSKSNLRNIICIPRILEEIIPGYAEHLGLKEWEVRQIFECFTVDADNIEYHLRDQKSFSPIFIRISQTHVMQSVYGSFNNPVLFLLRELTRRYKRDYDNNTDRERRFRNELYELIINNAAFKSKLITIERKIVLNVSGIRTDIDAVIFDRETRNLALVQLKWQMLFAHDLKERRNRLSEFRKAEEWVDKMKRWTSGRSSKDILSALAILEKLPVKNTQVNKVFLFVINRYNASFTGFMPSEDAAWASWYLIESIFDQLDHKLKNPIEYLDKILRSLALHKENLHAEMEGFKMELEGLKFVCS